MNDRATLYSHEKLAFYLSICNQAFNQILLLFNTELPAHTTPKVFNYLFNEIRSKVGDWKSVAEQLSITEEEIKEFNQTVRNYIKYEKISLKSNNAMIAVLRLVDQLERIKAKQSNLTYPTELYAKNQSHQFECIKKVRALELMIRDLINESYKTQKLLMQRLEKLFGRDVVKKWANSSDDGDILTGTNFSDLAALFVNKEEYSAHYRNIYEEHSLLGFMSEKRKTLRFFLDDVRYYRNRAAHHKALTSVQMELLNCYYFEISLPVQYAYDNETVSVNPDNYLDASQQDINHYLQRVENKLSLLGEDTAEIKSIVSRQEDKLDDVKKDTSLLRRKVMLVLAAVLLLNGISILLFYRSTSTLLNTEMILSDVGHIDKLMSQAKQEVIYDPRRELTKIGVSWSENNLREGIKSGDIRVVNLFLDGGMPWKLHYADNAMKFNYNGTLKSLLRHSSLMHDNIVNTKGEKNSKLQYGCSILFITAKNILLEERTLDPTQTDFLRTFCGSAEALTALEQQATNLLSKNSASENEKAKLSENEFLTTCRIKLVNEIRGSTRDAVISEEVENLISSYCARDLKTRNQSKDEAKNKEKEAWKALYNAIH